VRPFFPIANRKTESRSPIPLNYKFVLVDAQTGRDRVSWVLAMPAVLGRSPEAQLSIGDPSISRRHCQFSLDADGALIVRDLDSMNGTYIDDQRIKKAILRPGMVIQVGSLLLRIEWTKEPISERPVALDPNVNVTQPMQTRPSD
jgi:predicted component of type VI protein secretion system